MNYRTAFVERFPLKSSFHSNIKAASSWALFLSSSCFILTKRAFLQSRGTRFHLQISNINKKKHILPRVNLKAFWLFQANLVLNQIPSFFLWENSSKTINIALFQNYYLEFHSSSIIFHENRTVIFPVKLLLFNRIFNSVFIFNFIYSLV